MLCLIVNGCVTANGIRYRHGCEIELPDCEAERLKNMGVVSFVENIPVCENESVPMVEAEDGNQDTKTVPSVSKAKKRGRR